MKILVKIIVVLIFTLVGVLFFHSLASVNGDIGRHIKLGEVIWQSGEIPKTNLLSFTAPDQPFINHHWLSEVIFYGMYSLGSDWITGLKSIMIFKIIILLGTYFLLFLTVRRRNILSIILAFLVSISIFSARTDPRPEIFSYLIFAAYLLIIYPVRSSLAKVPIGTHAKGVSETSCGIGEYKLNLLWLLPIFQIFWVNLHIYFIIGPVIYVFYLAERAVLKKINRQDVLVGLAIVSANLINPNFIVGALYPFNVLTDYGYNVVENSSLFFLAKYFGQWAPQDKLFLASLFVLGGSFILNFWKARLINIKTRIFDLLLVAMTIFLSFKMQRSIPFYALSLWPIMTVNFNTEKRGLTPFLGVCALLVLVVSIYFVVSGKFYSWLNSPRTFGLEVSRAAQDGTDFIKINKIQGPVFNNFDIGSYLVWQLYPDQRIFVDGRPEAYPASFFKDVYKPMQSEANIWKQKADEYKINYVFFAHTDMTEWANEFLIRISKDNDWSMVFLNDAIVIFLKNNDVNRLVINNYKITEENINERAFSVLKKLNKKDDNAFVNFGNVLYRFRWFDASAKVYEALIVNRPDKPYSYQGAGYAYVAMNEPATQEKARQNLKKAIDLGFRSFNNYFTLGIINANQGNFTEAKENIKKALEINPNNQNAKEVLEIIKKKVE